MNNMEEYKAKREKARVDEKLARKVEIKNDYKKLKELLTPKPKSFVIQVQLKKPCRRITKYWAVNGKIAKFPTKESANLALHLIFSRKYVFPNDWRILSMSIEDYDRIKNRTPYVYPPGSPNEMD